MIIAKWKPWTKEVIRKYAPLLLFFRCQPVYMSCEASHVSTCCSYVWPVKCVPDYDSAAAVGAHATTLRGEFWKACEAYMDNFHYSNDRLAIDTYWFIDYARLRIEGSWLEYCADGKTQMYLHITQLQYLSKCRTLSDGVWPVHQFKFQLFLSLTQNHEYCNCGWLHSSRAFISRIKIS